MIQANPADFHFTGWARLDINHTHVPLNPSDGVGEEKESNAIIEKAAAAGEGRDEAEEREPERCWWVGGGNFSLGTAKLIPEPIQRQINFVRARPTLTALPAAAAQQSAHHSLAPATHGPAGSIKNLASPCIQRLVSKTGPLVPYSYRSQLQ